MFYLELFRCLHARNVRYLLAGGVAMNLHGVPRMTMDVDLVIALDDANVNAFLQCARDLALKPQAPVLLESLKDPDQRRSWIEEKHLIAFALVGAPDSGNRAAIPEAQLAAWTQEGVVEWWGQRADMPAVLASASVVALPSYGEGLPKVLLEAAAAGRPVVTTDVRGCREVVRPGVNGFLVPPRDSGMLAQAIERLLQSAEVRAAFGRAGRHLAETEFAEAVVVKQTLDVYRQVLNVH